MEWVLESVRCEITRDTSELLDRMYANLQTSGVGYCFTFPATADKEIKMYVELLLVYYYNISQTVRIVFPSHRGAEEKVMSVGEFVEGLYRIEKHRVEQEVFAKEETGKVILENKLENKPKNKPKRMFRIEGEKWLK